MTYPSRETTSSAPGDMPSSPAAHFVRLPAIIEHLPTGQVLITPVRFILPHELREEFVGMARLGAASRVKGTQEIL